MKTQTKEEPKVEEEKKVTGTEIAVYDYGEDMGRGLEEVDRGEFLIPIFRILEPLSPQCQDESEGGIPGARPGMIFNTSTQEVYQGREGFPFLPVARDYNYVEYVPRDAGGGFVGIHKPDEPNIVQLVNKQGYFKKLVTDEGTEITETRYLYGLAFPDGMDAPTYAVLTFSGGRMQSYQNFMTRLRGPGFSGRVNRGTDENPEWVTVVPPLWAHLWHASTRPRKMRKGTISTWRLSLEHDTPAASRLRMTDPLYAMGREFADLIASGRAKAAPPPSDDDAGEEGEGSFGSGRPDYGDKIPF